MAINNTLIVTDEFREHLTTILQEVLEYTGTSFLEIELTGRCENNCNYCGVGGPGNTDLHEKLLIVFIERWNTTIQSSGLKPVISLTGGDPLLYPYLQNILALIKKLNIPYVLKTNAHSIIHHLHRFDATPDAVKMTIPVSPDNGRHMDTLSDLYDATRYLHGKTIPVIWHASVYDGVMEELLTVLSKADQHVPLTFSVGRILPLSQKNSFSITPTLYRDFLIALLRIYQMHYKKGLTFRFRESLWIPVLQTFELLNRINLHKPGSCCDCYDSQLSIDCYGTVYPCGLLRKTILGTFRDSPALLLKTRAQMMNPCYSSCYSCAYFKFCGGCAGASQSITGSAYSTDPHCLKHLN